MKAEQRTAALEEELQVLKNEIKSILLEIREYCRNTQNSFTGFDRITVRDIDDDDAVLVDSPNPDGSKDTETIDSLLVDEVPPSAYESMTNSQSREREVEPIAERPNVPTRRRYQADYYGDSGTIDLMVIAGLTQWADQTTAVLGKGRAEALVDITHALHRLPDEVKDVLIKVIRLSPHENTNGNVISTKDYLIVLTKLNNLLASGHREDALLPILSVMTGSFDG